MAQKDIRVAIASNALGKTWAGHDIHRKLVAAKEHGFDGVEVAFECVEAHAKSLESLSDEPRTTQLLAAATDIRDMASKLSLELISLQPFMGYDSLAEDKDVKAGLQEAELWLQLCRILSAPILQIPSCFYPMKKPITSDVHRITDNMRKLCILADRYNVIVAYEAVAWGIHLNIWQQVRDIMRQVDMPNLKLCLDTYHIAAKTAGDPFNKESPVRPDGLEKLEESLEEMKETLQASEIGYLQLSDATVADPAQVDYPQQDFDQPAFKTQSRNCRLFPCEPEYGSVLPAYQVAKAVFDLGYRGWVSFEAFHTNHWSKNPEVPEKWAARGMRSWRNVTAKCLV